MTTAQPGPMKRPTQVPPTVPAMLRFVMAEAAKAGAVVEVDLNTGLLVVARMGGGPAPAPAEPPPALFLRALVANWRDLAAQPAPPTDAAKAARGVLDSVADQLEHTLDLMGVAMATPKWPSPSQRHHRPIAADHDLGNVWCGQCGRPLELHQGTSGPRWLDAEGLEWCGQ